jgi:hypothetical protein
MTKQNLKEAQNKTERALKLLSPEQADTIIGSPQPKEYGILIKGIEAAFHMLWMMAEANGMCQDEYTLRKGAQAQSILLTIVHYAYALGIKHGRESGK